MPHRFQQSPPRLYNMSSSIRSRSKSMDDFQSSGLIIENNSHNNNSNKLRTKYNKLNNNNNSHVNNLNKIRHYNNNFNNNVNSSYYNSANKLLSAKNHSMDNLLDVDSNYGCYYQVYTSSCHIKGIPMLYVLV